MGISYLRVICYAEHPTASLVPSRPNMDFLVEKFTMNKLMGPVPTRTEGQPINFILIVRFLQNFRIRTAGYETSQGVLKRSADGYSILILYLGLTIVNYSRRVRSLH